MNDDLNFLVQATLDHAEDYKGVNPFGFKENTLPHGPGVLYRVEKGTSTFVIRMIEAQDLAETLREIQNAPENYQNLRLNPDQVELEYFETPNFEMAEVLVETYANKRFPKNEQVLCNLSDPGFNWWLSHTNYSLSIAFKNYRLDNANNYQAIGPLGDSQLMSAKLNQCQAFIRDLFPVGYFFCNENLFNLEISHGDTFNFEKLKKIFIDGRSPEEVFNMEKMENRYRNALIYLREIAFLRKFWKQIESVI